LFDAIKYNSASTSGGGITLNFSSTANITIASATIELNYSRLGGNMYYYGGDSASLTLGSSSGKFVVQKGFACGENSYGGGLYIYKGTIRVENMEVKDCDSYYCAGGCCFDTCTLSTSKNFTITNCQARTSGGGMYVWDMGEGSYFNGTISNCRAQGGTDNSNGGGMVVYNNHKQYPFIMAGTIYDCHAIKTSSTAQSQGGGMRISGFCDIQGEIHDCTADTGGGIRIQGSDTVVKLQTGGIIYKNTANLNSGGGVAINSGAKFVIEGGSIEENTGTGVHNNWGTIEMTSGYIKKNKSNSRGGGVYLYTNNDDGFTVMIMTGGEISYNEALAGGAGIYIDDESGKRFYGDEGYGVTGVWPFVGLGGSIDYNKTTGDRNGWNNGGGILTYKRIYMKDMTVSHNIAKYGMGGGIAMFDNNGSKLINVTISDNYADTDIDPRNNDNMREYKSGRYYEWTQNYSGGHGGGIFAQDCSNLLIEGGTISDNVADLNGGGISFDGGSNIKLTASSTSSPLRIISNQARGHSWAEYGLDDMIHMWKWGRGGGLFLANGANVTLGESASQNAGCIVIGSGSNGNEAYQGGGIFVNESCGLEMYATYVQYNKADSSLNGYYPHASSTKIWGTELLYCELSGGGTVRERLNSGNGGGICVAQYGSLTVHSNCTISSNTQSSDSTAKGANVYVGGGNITLYSRTHVWELARLNGPISNFQDGVTNDDVDEGWVRSNETPDCAKNSRVRWYTSEGK